MREELRNIRQQSSSTSRSGVDLIIEEKHESLVVDGTKEHTSNKRTTRMTVVEALGDEEGEAGRTSKPLFW